MELANILKTHNKDMKIHSWSGRLPSSIGPPAFKQLLLLLCYSTGNAGSLGAELPRIPQLLDLLQAFVEHLGLFEVRVVCQYDHPGSLAIAVRTPETLKCKTWKPRRVVFVDADVLVSNGCRLQLSAILGNKTFAIHSTKISTDVEELISNAKGETHMIPKPEWGKLVKFGQMGNASFPVAATHTEMPRSTVEEIAEEFSQWHLLLIMNIYSRGDQR
ncbi:hypothetical protein SELMODRAFT_420089 [Selaginella moellendorffii]|uniref:Uncharacterized protein n=1 Tax=Selaginella moellendorffii TaxID=88036 RepID=D8SAI5_SELML|nr:hypothetical protein SELMODRAFT_420089 [Selaginella moellendorffii]